MSDLIEQVMKDKSNFYLRLTSADKWLVWQAPDAWVVYWRPMYANYTKTLYEGRSLERALEILLEDK